MLIVVVIPAQAGIQGPGESSLFFLDSRLRGNDARGCGNDARGRGNDARGRGNDALRG
jgi:hypothetical protein